MLIPVVNCIIIHGNGGGGLWKGDPKNVESRVYII